MDQPDHGAEPKFTRPLRQILTMLIVLGLVGVGVLGAGLGPRPRAPAGAHPDIGLVVLAAAQDGWTTASLACPASMPAHSAGKSGSVLAVVAMSSTSTPGTRSPMIAPAVAIR